MEKKKKKTRLETWRSIVQEHLLSTDGESLPRHKPKSHATPLSDSSERKGPPQEYFNKKLSWKLNTLRNLSKLIKIPFGNEIQDTYEQKTQKFSMSSFIHDKQVTTIKC